MLESLFLLIGSFVGAGFASGKEVFNFFTVFHVNGFISIFVFSLLTFFTIYRVLMIRYTQKIESYSDFLNLITSRYPLLDHRFFLLVINLFLIISFYIMIIALSTLFEYQLGIHRIIIIFVTILFCYPIFKKENIHFIFMMNTLLMPLLILFIIFLSTQTIHPISLNFNEVSSLGFSIINSILYFSYNSLLVIPMLFNIKMKSKKYVFLLAFLFSFILLILTLLINVILLSNITLISHVDLPILTICHSLTNSFTYFYFLIMLSAIVTTLLSSGYSFVKNLSSHSSNIALLIFLSFSFLFSLFSFSNLVSIFYPFFGLLGLLQIFLILYNKY